MMKSILAFILIFKFSLAAFAAGDFSNLMTYQDQIIYQETIQICQKSHSTLRAILNKNTLDAFLISTGQSLSLVFDPSQKAQDFQRVAAQNMLSDYTADRLKSLGFIQAVADCFPDNQKMQSAFVLSMMTADSFGKVPSIIALMYTIKGSSAAWGKLSAMYPKLSKSLKIVAGLSAVIYAVVETRAQFKNRQMTDYEKERIQKISAGMRENTDATKQLVIELANEELAQQEQNFASTNSLQEKQEIRLRINKIKEALSKV